MRHHLLECADDCLDRDLDNLDAYVHSNSAASAISTSMASALSRAPSAFAPFRAAAGRARRVPTATASRGRFREASQTRPATWSSRQGRFEASWVSLTQEATRGFMRLWQRSGCRSNCWIFRPVGPGCRTTRQCMSWRFTLVVRPR